MQNKIKVYCDNTTAPGWLIKLKDKSLVVLYYLPFENVHKKKQKKFEPIDPSGLTYNQSNFTYNHPGVTFNSASAELYKKIEKILGSDMEFDIKHLDSAYKNKCDCFITADKDEFIEGNDGKRREQLEKLLSIKIFHQQEEDKFKSFYKL